MTRSKASDRMDPDTVRVELLKARGRYLGALRAKADSAQVADLAEALAVLERRRADQLGAVLTAVVQGIADRA